MIEDEDKHLQGYDLTTKEEAQKEVHHLSTGMKQIITDMNNKEATPAQEIDLITSKEGTDILINIETIIMVTNLSKDGILTKKYGAGSNNNLIHGAAIDRLKKKIGEVQASTCKIIRRDVLTALDHINKGLVVRHSEQPVQTVEKEITGE